MTDSRSRAQYFEVRKRYNEGMRHAIKILVAGAVWMACDPGQRSAPRAPGSSPTPDDALDAGTPAAVNPVEAPSDGGSLEGAKCGYACGGMACDLACANDELFRCTPEGVWHRQENCAASGKKCKFTLIGGGPAATRSCQ
jgi:hypothetical protein